MPITWLVPLAHSRTSHSWFWTNQIFCVLSAEVPDAVVQIPLTHSTKARWFLCSGQGFRIKDSFIAKKQKRDFFTVGGLLGKDHSRGCTGEAEVVVLLYTWQRLEAGSEEAVPVVCHHKDLPSLITDQLGDVHIALRCAGAHSLADVF